MLEGINPQRLLGKLVFGFSVLIVFLLASNSYTQEYSKLDSVTSGRTYKIILFDETEIIGKVVKQDSLNIYLLSENMLKTIRKDDIFNISRNLTPSKYNFIISAGGGISFLVGDRYESSYRGYDSQFGLQLSGLFPFSDNKGMRIDFGFSKFKRSEDYYYLHNYNYNDTYEGGDLTFYSVKGEFVYGLLKPSSRFLVYGSVGLGLHVSHEEETRHTYYSSYDSTYQTWISPSEDYTFAVFSLGASAGYKFYRNFGVYVDAQYELITAYGLFFFGNGHFPLRAGVVYTF
jgi:hypothetical protein